MVEPVSLSLGAIVAALVARAAERAGDGAAAGGESLLRRLVDKLRARFAGAADEAAAGALARAQEVPDSPSRVRELAAVLDQRAAADPALRGELEALVGQARDGGIDVKGISQTVWGDQNVQAAGLVDSQVTVTYRHAAARTA